MDSTTERLCHMSNCPLSTDACILSVLEGVQEIRFHKKNLIRNYMNLRTRFLGFVIFWLTKARFFTRKL
jgi:hypothetical protein